MTETRDGEIDKLKLRFTEAASTLFRGVSVATKLVSAYFKLKGKEYLKKILSHLIKEVSTHSFFALSCSSLPPSLYIFIYC